MDIGLLINNSSTIFFFLAPSYFDVISRRIHLVNWLFGFEKKKKKFNYANICEEKNELPLYKLDGSAF